MSTIFALSTAPGKSGVAVIRISGENSLDALSAFGIRKKILPRVATFCKLKNGDELSPSQPKGSDGDWSESDRGARGSGGLATRRDKDIPKSSNDLGIIDEVLIIYFDAPHSYTGEDMLEIQCHGSRAVIRAILESLGKIKNFRHAEAGEFTKRALMNGKIGLVESEAVQDLINSETTSQQRLALRQMSGKISGVYDEMRDSILKSLAFLEAYIDFPDEDLPNELAEQVNASVVGLKLKIQRFLDLSLSGEKIRDGAYVAIVGAPNAGKSSLLNALAKRDVAIVSSMAGTTRDVIEVTLDIGGVEFILADTAGIRESSDAVESEGVRRALERAGQADIILALFDAGQLPQMDIETTRLIEGKTGDSLIVAASKSDLLADKSVISQSVIPLSVNTGQGLDELRAKLADIAEKFMVTANSAIVTSSRHRTHLESALDALDKFSLNKPIEIACEELRVAASEIGKITGHINVEELLDVIFKNFCIGK